MAILALAGVIAPAMATGGEKLAMKGRLICTAKFEDRTSRRNGNTRIRRPYRAEFDLDAMTVAEQGGAPRKIKFADLESIFGDGQYLSYDDDVKAYQTFALSEDRLMRSVVIKDELRTVFAACRRSPKAQGS